jgi:beta-N-acetylhexosaminidase
LLVGTKEEFRKNTRQFDSLNAVGKGVPLMYSADAELSLINMKIKGTTPVKKAFRINSDRELFEETTKICNDLSYMGIHQNFAPVADLSPNATVSMRSFGNQPDTVIKYCRQFIQYSTRQNILTCAKHFPGHGNVVGDTHKQLVFIDGEMTEIDLYKPLIEENVPSIMIGHIAVKNNLKYDTEGLPATCSRKIVTDLLKTELGYKGLIVTDALNMGGVANVPDCELLAAKAGCDILLMPADETKTIKAIMEEMKKDEDFRKQIHASVKKIIRLKICMGIIQ